ncbi:MAG: hypothetical protein IKR04_07065 [Clostridia bacterium]|nr:hypothetical protein [Clostridia bacterium]
MDNASKALVMAGAILIAVMLISFGVLIFNQMTGTGNQIVNQFDTMSLAGYNKTYSDYAGANKSAADVRALLQRVRAHNNNIDERTNYGSIQVNSNSFGATGGINALPSVTVSNGQAIRNNANDTVFSEGTIRDSKYYYIAVTEYNQLGAVSRVTVWQQANYFQN